MRSLEGCRWYGLLLVTEQYSLHYVNCTREAPSYCQVRRSAAQPGHVLLDQAPGLRTAAKAHSN